MSPEPRTPRRALRDPDTESSARLVTAVVWMLIAAAFAGSANALAAAAAATGLPTWLSWIGPVAIDGLIVVFLRVEAVMRRRGQKGRGYACDVVVVVVTGASLYLNVLHVQSLGQTGPMLIAAQIMAATFPLVILVASRAHDWLTIATPEDAARQAADREREEAAALRNASRRQIEEAREAARVQAQVEVEVARIRAEAGAKLAEIADKYPTAPPVPVARPVVESAAGLVVTPAPRVSAPIASSVPTPDGDDVDDAVLLERVLAIKAANPQWGQRKVAEEVGVSRARVQRLLTAHQPVEAVA